MRFAIVAAGVLAASAVMFSVTAARADDDKKLTVGVDAQFLLPLNSDFSNGSGPWIGGLARAGYRVIPPLEVTARIGYLAGLSKSESVLGQSVSSSISDIPLWIGARYFFGVPSDAPAGLYGAAEIAFNFMTAHESANGVSVSSGETREGFNLGVGYVLSQDLPIDFRVQFSDLNLLGTNSGEPSLLGLGLSVGYSFFF